MVVERLLICCCVGCLLVSLTIGVDPAGYAEPKEDVYWFRKDNGTEIDEVPPWDAPRRTDLNRQKFDELILDGQVFVVPGFSDDWPMRTWDCDFFQNDPEFKNAAMNHQYAAQSSGHTKLGDNWQSDKTKSGAVNETAPQIAPFYWGIKDVQYEQRPGWKKSMLKRVQQNFKIPHFMDPITGDSFGRTPEFWFGLNGAGAKAHMDSHIQSTVTVQISGTKRWRLMPLKERRAPFLGMIYQDGQPYTNPEGWTPLFNITLRPGEALFFPPGMIHETLNIEEVCGSSVTFQFDTPFAARFYRRFFPRVRRTADIHESWILIYKWARLGMEGDERGHGEPYEIARKSKKVGQHFQKLDVDGNQRLSLVELEKRLGSQAPNALAWHDGDEDGLVSLDEFRDGFGFWSAITYNAIKDTPEVGRQFQLFGALENLEDLPKKIAKKNVKIMLAREAKLLAAERGSDSAQIQEL